MANHVGTDGVVTIGGNTVAELTAFSIEENAATIDDSVLGTTTKSSKTGKIGWSGSIECHWDETDTTGQGAMAAGAEVTVVFLPEGNTTGDTSFTGTAVITGKSLSVGIDSMIAQSFTLEGRGALAEGTVA